MSGTYAIRVICSVMPGEFLIPFEFCDSVRVILGYTGDNFQFLGRTIKNHVHGLTITIMTL